MSDPSDHLRGRIAAKELAQATAAQPTATREWKPVGTPPVTGFASVAIDGLAWPEP